MTRQSKSSALKKAKPVSETAPEPTPLRVVKPRKNLSRMEFLKAATRITQDQEQIKYDLEQDRTSLLELADKYGMTVKVIGDVLAELGIRARKTRTTASMQIDLRKLERVVRNICEQLAIDYETI
jgi:hypothetical protein